MLNNKQLTIEEHKMEVINKVVNANLHVLAAEMIFHDSNNFSIFFLDNLVLTGSDEQVNPLPLR